MTLRGILLRGIAWLGVFLALFSGALSVLFETGALTPYVVESVDARLRPAGLGFRAVSIHWRPWSGLGLQDVVLETRTPEPAAEGESVPARQVISCRRIDVGYRLVDLVRGDLRVARVQLLRPDVDLDALLDWSAALSGVSAGGGPSFRIETIRIADGRVRGPEDEALTDLRLRGSLEAAPGEWRIGVGDMDGRLRMGRFDEDVRVKGDLRVADGVLALDGLRIAAAGGTIELRGSLDPRGRKDSDVVVAAKSVPLEKVGTWLDVEHPLLFARLDCDAVVTGRPDSMRVTARLEGLGHDDIERRIEVAGVRTGKVVTLERFRFEAAPSRLDLSGRLDFSDGPRIEGVAVFRDLEPAVLLADPDLVVVGDLDGAVRFAGAGLTRASFRGGVDVHLDGAKAFGLRFGAGTLSGVLDRGALEVPNARFAVAGSELEGHGTIDAANVVDAELRGDLADLAVLSQIGGAFRAAAPRGHGEVTVRVRGPVKAPEFDARLSVQDAAVAGLDAAELEVTAEALQLGATRVDFRAEGRDVGRGDRRFDRLAADGWSDARTLVFRSLDLDTDMAALSLAGRLDFGEQGRLDAVAERLSLRAKDGSSAWLNSGEVQVTRTPDAVTVKGLRLEGDGGSISGEVTVLPGGATAVRAAGRSVDLRIFGPLLARDSAVAGHADFDGHALIRPDSLGADLRLSIADGRIGGRAFKSLAGHVVAGEEIVLRDVTMEAPALSGTLSGALRLPEGSLRKALVDREARTRALEGSTLRDVRVHATSPDLAWLWERIPKAPASGGSGRLDADIDGPFLRPVVHAQVRLDGGQVGSEPLTSFTARADFDGEVLEIRDGMLRTGQDSLEVSGLVPLEWTAADPRPRLRQGRAVDLRGVAKGFPLQALSRTISLFQALQGDADARVQLTGQPGSLALAGEFSVSNGRLEIPTFDEPLVAGTATGRFDTGGIEITSGRFEDGRGGTLTGTGRVELANLRATDWNLDVRAREYHYRAGIIDTKAIGSGTMRILTRTTSEGRMVPFYQGSFRVSRADIGPKALTPPGSVAAGGESELPPGVVAPPDPAVPDSTNLVALPAPGSPGTPVAFLAEIGLKGDRNLWLKTPEMDLELTGDVVFHATERGMGLAGEVSTLRGTYSVLNSRFTVDRADVDLTDPGDPAASYIDAEASTTVLDENVTAYVTGPLITPNIRLETESGMSEAEIYELLALRVKRSDDPTAAAADEGALGNAFRRSYVAALTNRFGGEIGRELGLDTFEYEGETGARSVTVGKNVGRDFFFKYRQAVGGTAAADGETEGSVTREALESPERALTIEYRLNRIFMLQGETGTLPPGDDYLNVDLKAEWGY